MEIPTSIEIAAVRGGWIVQHPIWEPDPETGDEEQWVQTVTCSTLEGLLSTIERATNEILRMADDDLEEVKKGMKFYKPPKGDDDTPVKA